MKKEKFYHKFANTPLSDRDKILNFSELGSKTLRDFYIEIKNIDDKLRKDEIYRERLLKEVEPFL